MARSVRMTEFVFEAQTLVREVRRDLEQLLKEVAQKKRGCAHD
jgi:hypothetical protein